MSGHRAPSARTPIVAGRDLDRHLRALIARRRVAGRTGRCIAVMVVTGDLSAEELRPPARRASPQSHAPAPARRRVASARCPRRASRGGSLRGCDRCCVRQTWRGFRTRRIEVLLGRHRPLDPWPGVGNRVVVAEGNHMVAVEPERISGYRDCGEETDSMRCSS